MRENTSDFYSQNLVQEKVNDQASIVYLHSIHMYLFRYAVDVIWINNSNAQLWSNCPNSLTILPGAGEMRREWKDITNMLAQFCVTDNTNCIYT